MVAAAVVS
ncbi:hypothetical protein P8C59_007361 [Phyllachora maydis]|uniref:Uncharacterized protein n=1 Tax=Phyllachora maydis TaxID=1825666 RepID=A0AAD9ME57_9PEZI|nr:hypothetical protein P8C59_007361 [Phyllachora maydis]